MLAILLAGLTTYFGTRMMEAFSPTERARRTSALIESSLPPRYPAKSGPRQERKVSLDVFDLVSTDPDLILTFAQQQEIDRQYQSLATYDGEGIDFQKLRKLRMQQEPYVLTALQAQFRFPADELEQLARAMRYQRSVELDRFYANLSLIKMDDGKEIAVISDQALRAAINPVIWIRSMERSTEEPHLALALKWAQRHFTVVPGHKFTEGTYRLFRLLQLLKTPA